MKQVTSPFDFQQPGRSIFLCFCEIYRICHMEGPTARWAARKVSKSQVLEEVGQR